MGQLPALYFRSTLNLNISHSESIDGEKKVLRSYTTPDVEKDEKLCVKKNQTKSNISGHLSPIDLHARIG